MTDKIALRFRRKDFTEMKKMDVRMNGEIMPNLKKNLPDSDPGKHISFKTAYTKKSVNVTTNPIFIRGMEVERW